MAKCIGFLFQVKEGRAVNVGDIFHGEVGMVSVPTYDLLNYYSLLKGDPREFADVKIIKKKSEASSSRHRILLNNWKHKPADQLKYYEQTKEPNTEEKSSSLPETGREYTLLKLEFTAPGSYC